MKPTQRNFLIFLTLIAVIAATSAIKHVPLHNLMSASCFLMIACSYIAAAAKMGGTRVVDALEGKNAEAAEVLIKATLFASALSTFFGIFVVFINFQTPDNIGPGVTTALLSFVYGLLMTGYLSIANRVTKYSQVIAFYSAAGVFVNFALAMTVIFMVSKL